MSRQTDRRLAEQERWIGLAWMMLGPVEEAAAEAQHDQRSPEGELASTREPGPPAKLYRYERR
jgi:hypothetical protein